MGCLTRRPTPIFWCSPTHFVAVQVSHEEHVVEAIQKVQSALVGHTAGLKEALVDPVTAHLTLMVMLTPFII